MTPPNLFDDIMAIARSGFERGRAGIKSGLNNRNYTASDLFGMDQVYGVPARAQNYASAAQRVYKNKNLNTFGKRLHVMGMGQGAAKRVGRYFGASDIADYNKTATITQRRSRGMAAGARIGGALGIAGTGVAALDFFNPFGFGWND